MTISKFATNNVCEMTELSKTEFMRNSHLCCKFCNKEFTHRTRHKTHELQCEITAFNIMHNITENRLNLHDCFDYSKNKLLKEDIFINGKIEKCKNIGNYINKQNDNNNDIFKTESKPHIQPTLITTKPSKPKKKVSCIMQDCDLVIKPDNNEITKPIPISTDIDNNKIIQVENDKTIKIVNDEKIGSVEFASSSEKLSTDTIATDLILHFDDKSFELDEIKNNEYDDIYTYIVDNIEIINDTHTYYKCKTTNKYNDVYYLFIRKHIKKPNVVKIYYLTDDMKNYDFIEWKESINYNPFDEIYGYETSSNFHNPQ